VCVFRKVFRLKDDRGSLSDDDIFAVPENLSRTLIPTDNKVFLGQMKDGKILCFFDKRLAMEFAKPFC
jgi:hypothetical protein